MCHPPQTPSTFRALSRADVDETRIAIWEAFADQFLDTETRTWIPHAALLCVDAGLTVSEARDIWRYEVTPAVYFNVWDIAGEWACWDRDWLTQRIERRRGWWPNRPGCVPALIYRARVHFLHESWVGIEGCMRVLRIHGRERRAELAHDLSRLARIFFDFGATDLSTGERERVSAQDRVRLATVYDLVFRPIFLPLAVDEPITGETKSVCHARVMDALS